MIALENPFFLKELRATGRRHFAPLSLMIVAHVVTLCFPLWLLERWPVGVDAPARAILGLLLVGLAHILVTAFAGWVAGTRVFMEEHRQQTLDSLRLSSTHPMRWLLAKLAYPLYSVGLVWAAGLPMLLVICARGHYQPAQLAPASFLALCAGLTNLGGALMLPPEGPRQRFRVRLTASDFFFDLSRTALPQWTQLIIATLGVDWLWAYGRAFLGTGRALMSTAFDPFGPRRFLDTQVRADHGLGILLLLTAVGALCSAFSEADPAAPWGLALARGSRLVGVACAYAIFAGYQWPGANPTARLFLVAIPAVGLLFWGFQSAVSRRRKRRSEDPQSVREIGRIGRWWDNPVLIRDLRVSLRGASLRRSFFRTILQIVLGMALICTSTLLPFLTLAARSMPMGGTGAWLMLVFKVAGGVGWVAVIPAFLTLGIRASTHWQGERRTRTLGQLASTRLTSEEIVRGRWLAGLLVGGCRVLPLVLVFIPAVLALQEGKGLDISFSILGWLASLGLLLSAGCAGPITRVERLPDLVASVLVTVYLLIAEGFGLPWLLSQNEISNPAATSVAYALTMTALNIAMTYPIYRLSVANFESMRSEERARGSRSAA